MLKEIQNIDEYKDLLVQHSRLEVFNLDNTCNKTLLISNGVKCCANYRRCAHSGMVVDVYVLHNQITLDNLLHLAKGIVDTVLNTWRCIIFLPDNHILVIFPDRTAIEIKSEFIFWDKYLPDFSNYNTEYLYNISEASCVELEIKKGYDDNRKDVLKEALHDIFAIESPDVSVSSLFLTSFAPKLDIGHMSIKLRYDSSISDRKLFQHRYAPPKHKYIENHNVIPLLATKGNTEDLSQVMNEQYWGFSLHQIKAIYDYFSKIEKRDPTDAEMEFLAQTWSEHCKHNIMSYPIDDIKDGLYKTYIQGATNKIMKTRPNFCMSVFSDNAGAIRLNDEYSIVCKVETHNTPCAIMPCGGAVTGILGVNRDILGVGLGALPIANVFGFCFNDIDHMEPMYYDQYLERPVLNNAKIGIGVIEGIEKGGNLSGIPTVQGFMKFSNGFVAKPLVFAGSIGIIPNKDEKNISSFDRNPNNGDLIVIMGSKVGRDGIHGATVSSSGLSSNISSRMVQRGNPFLQKKFSDALIKDIRNLGLYSAITDNGAGGFSSSIGELGIKGFHVDLDKVMPYMKEESMAPWEIWVSESQERMTLAVPADKFEKLQKIAEIHDIVVYEIGIFNHSKRAIVTYDNDKKAVDISTDFLHNGLPPEQLLTEEITELSKISEKIFSDIPEMLRATLTFVVVTFYSNNMTMKYKEIAS